MTYKDYYHKKIRKKCHWTFMWTNLKSICASLRINRRIRAFITRQLQSTVDLREFDEGISVWWFTGPPQKFISS